MSLGKRIQAARRNKKMSQTELGQKIGRRKSVISNWENDTNKPDADTIFELCDILEVEPNWMLEWEEKYSMDLTFEEQNLIRMYRELDLYDRDTFSCILLRLVDKPKPSEPVILEPTKTFDLYTLRPSAGNGNVMLDEVDKQRISYPVNKMTQKADFLVRVDGHSMEPELMDGEVIFVQRAPDVEIGEIGLFTVNGSALVKEKQADRLHSLNPEFEDIPIHEWDDVVCYGKVLN